MSRNAVLPPGDPCPETMTESLFSPEMYNREALDNVRKKRNQAWSENPLIPSWVNPESVDLDRFFTRPDVAHSCYASLANIMSADHADCGRYMYVDPAAGEGAFYDILPTGRRIGMEIVPGRLDMECRDFLGWKPPPLNGGRYAVIGNSPFGYRAWLALAFVNHAATFADYIGMILPMAFQSNGKGSPKFRVEGAELVTSAMLTANAFMLPGGQPAKVNALWQVWRRGVNNRPPEKTCKTWIDMFTVDVRKERLCGQDRLHEADWFLQRTFYGEPPVLVKDFDKVRYGCGYGIVLKKQKQQLTDALNFADWRVHSNLAAHNCRHISMEHVRDVMIESGFVDDP